MNLGGESAVWDCKSQAPTPRSIAVLVSVMAYHVLEIKRKGIPRHILSTIFFLVPFLQPLHHTCF